MHPLPQLACVSSRQRESTKGKKAVGSAVPGHADDGLWGLESSGSNGQKVMGGLINRMDRGAEMSCYAL